MKKTLISLPFALCTVAATAACPTWSTAERFAINGAEVTDQRTGLVWARCSVGQSWSGSTCVGSASTFTHGGAMTHAKVQSGWRLPSVKELASLADKGCVDPAIDSAAFPVTPSAWYWSSSPHVGSSDAAWYVYFYKGSVTTYRNSAYRDDNSYVRLVRTSQ